MGSARHILVVALALVPLAGAGAERAGAEMSAREWTETGQAGAENGAREWPQTPPPDTPKSGGKGGVPEVGVPTGAIEFDVEPLDGDVRWLRQEVDPIWQARRRIHLAMRERARERALESRPKQGREASANPGFDVGDWRFSIGNNGNWSPYPDRELDARNIRFPLRMKTDNRTPAEKALERMRQEGRH